MWRHNVQSLQCDAAHLPLENDSVDLIITSPPYFALRDYQENGQSLKGQVGNEPTPQEFLDSLWKCTEEWMRVLKPRGSIFVNLGDKWAGGGGGPPGRNVATYGDDNPFPVGRGTVVNRGATWGFKGKSLMNIPARYAIGCTDQLGLIEREEIVWRKVNGLPESVRDRCRRSHELIYHFTKQGEYYSAIARIREEQESKGKRHKGKSGWQDAPGDIARGFAERELSPKGKLPPSVWDIPASWPDILRALPPELAAQVAAEMGLPEDVWDIALAPLNVPKYLEEESLDGTAFDFDHFAAYPPDLVQKIILGWSPKDVCTKCGQGRFPVTVDELAVHHEQANVYRQGKADGQARWDSDDPVKVVGTSQSQIIGNACACTPYEDHPERRGKDWRGGVEQDRKVSGQRMGKEFQGNGHPSRSGGEFKPSSDTNEYGRGQVREYLLDQWDPAPTVPGTVLDPFGGTGTTAITAAKLSRQGITCDLSYDYAKRLVDWRTWDLSQNRRK
jgi:DNA modification methylase